MRSFTTYTRILAECKLYTFLPIYSKRKTVFLRYIFLNAMLINNLTCGKNIFPAPNKSPTIDMPW